MMMIMIDLVVVMVTILGPEVVQIFQDVKDLVTDFLVHVEDRMALMTDLLVLVILIDFLVLEVQAMDQTDLVGLEVLVIGQTDFLVHEVLMMILINFRVRQMMMMAVEISFLPGLEEEEEEVEVF